MLEIPYVKIIPYPFAVILDQYFDFEHVAHVHPTSLGECVVVENTGKRIVYDQLWPADRNGHRSTSRVLQTYQPPGEIWFEFTSGKYQGTMVHSQLRPHQDGTEITETYHLPRLPNWGFLRWLIAPFVVRHVERIWEEDLRVGVCIGGWPGVPDHPRQAEAAEWRRPLKPGTYRLGCVSEFAPGSLKVVETYGGRVLIAHSAHGYHAMHPTCPHTGGPLERGWLDEGCLVCPWHGARFDITTGQCLNGPTHIPLPIYDVRVEAGELVAESC